jgi:hypothetical protein
MSISLSLSILEILNDASMSVRSLASELVRGLVYAPSRGLNALGEAIFFFFRFPFYTIVSMLTLS